jgi:Protein of unknown function (DUF2845)
MKAAMLALCLALAPLAAYADGMRCGNALITQGDDLLRVQHECGDPTYATQYTVYASQPLYDGFLRVYSDITVPVQVEEWTYNLGPTRFMRKLRFENGQLITIQSLSYGY